MLLYSACSATCVSEVDLSTDTVRCRRSPAGAVPRSGSTLQTRSVSRLNAPVVHDSTSNIAPFDFTKDCTSIFTKDCTSFPVPHFIQKCKEMGTASKSRRVRDVPVQDVGAADQLFATLDTKIRSAQIGGGESVLLVDTVGFIQGLPLSLVAAFQATLDEATQAHLLVRPLPCFVWYPRPGFTPFNPNRVQHVTAASSYILFASCLYFELQTSVIVWRTAHDQRVLG